MICLRYFWNSLRENCPYLELFWPAFSRVRTEYGEIQYLSVFSPNAGKYGKIRTRITPNTDTFYAVLTTNLNSSQEIFQLHSRRSPQMVFLGKGIPKICSNFTGEHSYFGMSVLPYICCIFSEQFFLMAHQRAAFLLEQACSQGIFRTLTNIKDTAFFKNSQRRKDTLKAFDDLAEKLY